MKEIGGYIELDTFHMPMLHEEALKLNCGRNALWYLLKAKGIHKIWMPKFMCDSCNGVLKAENVIVKLYSVGLDFLPKNLHPMEDEWVYLVNYYGQVSNDYVIKFIKNHSKIIVDNSQAYFQMPVPGVDTLYTCRKFFGVSDGAILYTDAMMEKELPIDESFERIHYILGRYERTAGEFYAEASHNNEIFSNEPIKKMSKLTQNLLHAIDYQEVKMRRTENFAYLHSRLNLLNKLDVHVVDGAFMYPLYLENGAEIRKKLQAKKIYIPTLWPDVFNVCTEDELEFDMANNILPIPCDQRYSIDDMEQIISLFNIMIVT